MKSLSNLKKIFIWFILFIFLFPSLNIYTNYSLADNETAEENTEAEQNTEAEENAETDTQQMGINSYGTSWKIAPFYTGYGAGAIDSKYQNRSFSRNVKYGWYEFEKGNETYVALLGPTEGTEDVYHFKIGETIYFQFDQRNSSDKNIYTGMIIGSAINIGNYGQDEDAYDSQYIFAYVGVDEEEAGREDILDEVEKFTNKDILISSTGKFPTTVNKASEGNLWTNAISTLLLFLGDVIEKLLTAEITGTSFEKMPDKFPIYTKAEIDANPAMKNAIQVEKYKKNNKNNKNNKNEENTQEQQEQTQKNEKAGFYTFTVPKRLINQTGNFEEVLDDYKQIPVIPSDLFVLARTKINICDIDFFSKENTNTNKLFVLVKKVVRMGSKIMLYITAALFLTTLIFRSIMLVMASNTRKSRKGKKSKKKNKCIA